MLPLGESWGEGAFPRSDAQSCYVFWCVPSFETVSPVPLARCPSHEQDARPTKTMLNAKLSGNSRILPIREVPRGLMGKDSVNENLLVG